MPDIKKTPLFFLFFILSLNTIFSQKKTENFQAFKTEENIIIDGNLDEEAWNKAADATPFIVEHPDRSQPSLVQTTAKILFDDSFLYLAFICQDSQPESIHAQVTQKDADIRVDDSIYLLIDTAPNISNFFFYATNPLGTMSEGSLSKNGESFDPFWNAEWKTKAVKTSIGWQAEIAIELKSLMISPQTSTSIGLALSRVVPRLDSSFWTSPIDPAFDISEMGQLKVLQFMTEEKTLQIKPYAFSSTGNADINTINGGADIKLNLSRTSAVYGSINPEFCTVEPDQEKVNLTRYELWHPEKRYFFQSELMQERLPIDLFYSKRINDIYGGVKLEGTEGRFDFFGMSAQSYKNEDMNLDPANYSVLRIRRHMSDSFTMGFLTANKLVQGENIGTIGLDSSVKLNKNIHFMGQLALSYGNFSTDNLAFYLNPRYSNETLYLDLRYVHLDKYFGDNVNEVGFIPDDNRRELGLALEKSFILNKWGIQNIRYISDYDIFWGTDGTLRSWQLDQGIVLEKLNRFMLSLIHIREFKLFERDYYNHRTTFFIGLDTREWQLFNLILTIGRNFGEPFRVGEINKRFLIGRNLSLEYGYQSLNYPRLGSYANGIILKKMSQIHVIRTIYTISENLSFKTFFQSNNKISKQNFQIVFDYRFLGPSGYLEIGILKGDPHFGMAGDPGTNIYTRFSYLF